MVSQSIQHRFFDTIHCLHCCPPAVQLRVLHIIVILAHWDRQPGDSESQLVDKSFRESVCELGSHQVNN